MTDAQVSHWGAVSRRVVRAFNGRSNLPVYELAKAKVEKPHWPPDRYLKHRATFSSVPGV